MPAAESDESMVFRSATREVTDERRLVLEAVGVPSRLVLDDGEWSLFVPDQDTELAIRELTAYRDDLFSEPPSITPPKVTVFAGAIAAVIYFILMEVSIHVLCVTSAYDIDWLLIGQMKAGDVMTGQWWRTITALTLHADGTHLVSNLVFGSLFGIMAGRLLGGGVAWLTILAAGASGNALNAMMRPAEHVSIGASTAVFASLGILVAHALRPTMPIGSDWWRRWSPLIGGVLMLSFIGLEGERTDVLAHVTGFCGGVVLGWGVCRLPSRWLANSMLQMTAGVAALGLVIAAWRIAA